MVFEGEEIVTRVSAGRWFIVSGRCRARRSGRARRRRRRLRRPRLTMFCNVVTGALRRNRCAATGVALQPRTALRRNQLLCEVDALVADKEWTASSWRFRSVEAASA